LPEVVHPQDAPEPRAKHDALPPAAAAGSYTSFAALWQTVRARRWFVGSVIGGLSLLCLLYCLIAPNQYEAKARVVLHITQGSLLGLDGESNSVPSGFGGATSEIETIANVFRSDRLAWRVILDHKLYRNSDFNGSFARYFPDFRPEVPNPAAQEYLLKRFARHLHVSTIPRTLLVEIRFRTKNAALSAEVVKALIQSFNQEESSMRVNETRTATEYLNSQLMLLKAQADAKEREMEAFKRENGVMLAPGARSDVQAQGLPQLVEVDEIARALAAAAAERVLRESRYKVAVEGNPELVLGSDSPVLADDGSMEVAVFKQIQAKRGDLQQELAQLTLEHGPNYGRVVEVRRQLEDLDSQVKSERGNLLEMMRRAMETARDREAMLRTQLDEKTSEGEKATDAAMRYAAMALEDSALQEMYIRIQGKLREAGLEAGVHPPDIWVVDPPIVPSKPAAPNLPLYMAVTLFVAIWLALGGAFIMESLNPRALRNTVAVLFLLVAVATHAQAPIPNTQGLPGGVTKVITPEQPRNVPDPRTSPPVWSGAGSNATVLQESGVGVAMAPAQLSSGDLLDVSEFHTPEFHSTVRIAEAGTVVLPMIGEIKLAGLDEAGASRAIAAELVEKGFLLHPQVFVLVTQVVGQDVSVLGEVTRPGVYAFTVHHRLLDLIAAASGTSPTAGGVVGIFHRNDPDTPHIVSLRAVASGADEEHNPELEPGDTVQVNRAGFIYVVGGVMRPGGFAMDPQQHLTVLQALSLAWGPSQSAATQKAMLIREQQDGGRLVTALNLKRMLRGQDPDPPLRERDILFVPDSLAKSIWNHSLESAIQSAAGVSLYAGMVYSQRF